MNFTDNEQRFDTVVIGTKASASLSGGLVSAMPLVSHLAKTLLSIVSKVLKHMHKTYCFCAR